MDNKIFIFRHNRASQGARQLSLHLGVPMIKMVDSNFVGGRSKTIINWGCGEGFPFDAGETRIINRPEMVHRVTNKRIFLEMCREAGSVTIPDFTTERLEAAEWLQGGSTVFARTILQGSGGEGIVELVKSKDLNKINEGTLLVKYVKKKREFRIHTGKECGIFGVQEKKRSRDILLENINWRIRNVKNGFIFARRDLEVPEKILTEALAALKVSGLDFGAIDILWSERNEQATVLEINTAPGIEGTTVLEYVEFFRELLKLKETTKPKDILTHGISNIAPQHIVYAGITEFE